MAADEQKIPVDRVGILALRLGDPGLGQHTPGRPDRPVADGVVSVLVEFGAPAWVFANDAAMTA